MFHARLWTWLPLLALLAQTLRLAAQVTVFSENFEAAFPATGGWSISDANTNGTPAYWGAVDAAFGGAGVHGGSFKGYCAGVGFAGTAANPLYQNDMQAAMSRTVDLRGYSAATLSFWFKIPAIENYFDAAQVWIDDSLLWSGGTAVTSWTQTNLDLSSFAGGAHTLQFRFASDFSNQYEGCYLDDILLTATVANRPTNDNFAAAYVLTGSSGSTNGTNAGATSEAGEPDHAGASGGRSIWYVWTASANGAAVFDTLGSSLDTVLAVYTGTSVTNLTLVGENDDINPGVVLQSRVAFKVSSGNTYHIAVDGYLGATGSTVLNWIEVTAAPPNDAFNSAMVLSGASGSAAGTNYNASKQNNEPDHAGNPGGASIWYQWTPTTSGLVTFQTHGSSFDTLLGIYTGNNVGGLSLVASNDDVGTFFSTSQASFMAAADTLYRIAVDGFDSSLGTVRLAWSQATPTNDYFTNATILTGASGSVTGLNFNATAEPGEPLHAGQSGGHSVWYRASSAGNSMATFDTDGSELDALLAVYTGASVSNLTLVASDLNGSTPASSRVAFPMLAGQTYRIAVDGFDGAEWTFKLNWTTMPAQAPSVTLQPQSPTVAQGGSATLSLTASGTQPLNFQWRFNGAPITDATSATLNLTNVQPAQAGNYDAVVSNPFGSATSQIATLTVTVLSPPSVTTSPGSLTVLEGSSASFLAMATGSAPLSFQWRRNGAAVVGQTATNFTIASVGTNDTGSYTVVVANSSGAVTSAPPMSLAVVGLPQLTLTNVSSNFVSAWLNQYPGAAYAVDYGDSLALTNWDLWSNLPAVTMASNVFLHLPATNSARFFRVRLSIP